MQDLRKANKKSKKSGFSGKKGWSDNPMQPKKPTQIPPPMPDLRYIDSVLPGETKQLPPKITPVTPHLGVPPPPFLEASRARAAHHALRGIGVKCPCPPNLTKERPVSPCQDPLGSPVAPQKRVPRQLPPCYHKGRERSC